MPAEVTSSKVVGHREITVTQTVKVRQSRTTPADPESSDQTPKIEYDDVDTPVSGTLVYPLDLPEDEAKRRAVIDFGINFATQIEALSKLNR